MAPGKVYLVGAGPGDPGLLTIAARDAIATADVIYVDALAPVAAVAFARRDATIHDVGKRGGEAQPSQEVILSAMIADAVAGRVVVRLKGGDPFVFGRGGEEAQACREAGIPFVVIPGVTSAIAGPAYAGIPVTHRDIARSFAVVTGTTRDNSALDWAGFAGVDTLVVLMGARHLGSIATELVASGRDPDTPAALIRWATTPRQQTITATLATIAEAGAELGPPAVLIVGETVGLAGVLAWYTPGPLAGKSIVVTTSEAINGPLATALRQRGAEVAVVPLIAITPAPPERLMAALRQHDGWLVLPSRNAVRSLGFALQSAHLDARAVARYRLAVAGPGSAAELLTLGLRADFQPVAAGAAAIAAEIPFDDTASVLVLQSNRAGAALQSGLAARGATTVVVEAYRTEPALLGRHQLESLHAADAITIASPSAAEALAASVREPSPRLVAIGPTTAAAARAVFGRIDAVASDPSPASLADAVEEALG
jgi:uroporphyrinogen III methyltransferase/synthase